MLALRAYYVSKTGFVVSEATIRKGVLNHRLGALGRFIALQADYLKKPSEFSLGRRTKVVHLPNISEKLATVYLGLVRYIGFVQPVLFELELPVDVRDAVFTAESTSHLSVTSRLLISSCQLASEWEMLLSCLGILVF